ncbi:MAG: Holliday junction branch migration protein RuvA [Proteobacteria bacterium]|nr:Holliday junction branch migration protein RuvA [Pseudomonadota bacterium]
MIGSLTGVLAEKAPPRILIDVQGVGYDVEVPMSTFYALPATGAALRLLIHQVVREDALLLYGFATEPERVLFRHLLKVSGVGPRIALAILSGISLDAFAQLMQADDVAALTRIPGVGRKTAERLLVELRDRVKPADGAAAVAGAVAAGAPAEALQALLALGYKDAEATRLVSLAGDGAQTTEEIIRRALQSAGRG